MDNREILTRFKNGDLDRQSAMALLTGPALPPPPPVAPPPPPPPPQPSETSVPDRVVGDSGRYAGTVEDGERYAVVALAGRFPQAPDLDAFWRNALDGTDTAAPPPRDRDTGPAEGNGHYLDAVDEFDAAFFGLTDGEAVLMDPQERLLLETLWETLEAAGLTGARLDALTSADGSPRSLGVYAAAASRDYALLAAGLWAGGHHDLLPGGGHWSLPGRLSTLLDLTGPSQCVDTAESSFLVALHQAVGALRAGECAAALVGAVELRLHPSRLAPGGGEGVCAVLLKPLAAAERDGDTVHAVVRSTAVRHVGPGGGEAGGSGGFGGAGDSGGAVVESERTVRAAVGSAGAATGAAALVRAVLQLRAGTLAATPGGAGPDAWQRPRDGDGTERARRVSVVVRGSGGTEARAAVEEYRPVVRRQARPPEPEGGQPALVLLSAPTPAHLVATARRLADGLTGRTPEDGVPLRPADVAAELRSGRAAREYRLAVTAQDTVRLATALDDFVQDPGAAALRGRDARPVPGLVSTDDPERRPGPPLLDDLPETRAYLAALWQGECFEQLTRLWLAGVDVTRAAVPHGRVVALPTSALRRRRLWIGRVTPAEGDAGTERGR
ncbi:polyketide synthase [Streptomyces sp. NPDC053750]|uniref:polyketide synthase n=1 Tax=Streptomyces sp. NPDC053750 TaxID=3365714 RepID=UPI0037D904AD